MTGHTGWVHEVACATLGDGTPVAVTAGIDETVRVWNLATQSGTSLLALPETPYAVAVSPAGLVVTFGWDVALFLPPPGLSLSGFRAASA